MGLDRWVDWPDERAEANAGRECHEHQRGPQPLEAPRVEIAKESCEPTLARLLEQRSGHDIARYGEKDVDSDEAAREVRRVEMEDDDGDDDDDEIEFQTIISGPVFTDEVTWNTAGSPYYIAAEIVFLEGASLTIEPGVSIYFAPSASIELRGDLQAVGLSSNPITMHGAELRFNRASSCPCPPTWDVSGNYVSGPRLEHVDMADGTLHPFEHQPRGATEKHSTYKLHDL
mgnify:CR=1 FL=1